MSPNVPPDVGATFRLLRARYRMASAGTPALFDAIARRLAGTPGSPDALAELQRELHRVRGTAGSYGYMDVSRLAEALEAQVVGWRSDPALDREGRAATIADFAVAIRRCFERPDAPPDASGSVGSAPE